MRKEKILTIYPVIEVSVWLLFLLLTPFFSILFSSLDFGEFALII